MAVFVAVLAMTLVFAGSVPAATMSDEQLVQTRTAAMKQNGQILRGAKNLSGAKAVDAANTVLKNFTSFPGLFREGSITPNSRATPKIWQNWADFTKRMAAEKASAQAMLVAAKAGKTADYQAAIDALKGRCSSCHLTYAH
ncbi:MAG: cytochrome c [Devosia sp.]